MKPSRLAIGLSLAFLILSGLVLQSGVVRALPQSIRDELGWGFILRTDRPFYASGDVADVLAGVFNYSPDDAFGVSWDACIYRLRITDDQGRVVWDQLPICGQVVTPIDLPAGSRVATREQVPLVYRNLGGIGTPGDPLPPGFYRVEAELRFAGPERMHFPDGIGLNQTAAVPIRIE